MHKLLGSLETETGTKGSFGLSNGDPQGHWCLHGETDTVRCHTLAPSEIRRHRREVQDVQLSVPVHVALLTR